jgi:hypothetical protein
LSSDDLDLDLRRHNARVKPRPDVVDLSVGGGDQEGLVNGCDDATAGQLGLCDDRERGVYFIPVDGVPAVGGCGDDVVLRSTIKAAPQMISGEAGLDALFEADT